MQFKESFINPLRMYCEHRGFTKRFKYLDLQATRLRPCRRIDPKKGFAKGSFFPRLRLKTDDEMK